jgi:hypothetical protein
MNSRNRPAAERTQVDPLQARIRAAHSYRPTVGRVGNRRAQ